jgi:two-component system, chemotaxis family, protein-glutamate methylesterase/glutaminase
MPKKIKVLIVDDSALVRQSLEGILDSDPAIEIMGTAADPFAAAKKIMAEVPDVITLDVEMPRMDGITFLKKIMCQHPIPVVICSSLVGNGCETTLMALEYGAVEIIEKPKIGIKRFFEESRIIICDAVKAASHVRVKPVYEKKMPITKKLTADAIIAPPSGRAMARTTEKIGVVGASTGGVEALRIFLEVIPSDSPGIVIVQHMPKNFTKAFARRINDLCKIEVKEAKDGDRVLRGMAMIAPGNRHTILKRSGAQYYLDIKDGPLVCRHRPSVDVLFRSAARYAGGNAVGVIMTGMGDDGAKGLLEMKQAGAFTIAQNEESCVVFGMPQEAIKLGAVDKILPLDKISGALLRVCSR